MTGFENSTCADVTEVSEFFDNHILIGYVPNTFVNKTMFDDNPIRTLNDVVFYE
jgi:hypothetical protein